MSRLSPSDRNRKDSPAELRSPRSSASARFASCSLVVLLALAGLPAGVSAESSGQKGCQRFMHRMKGLGRWEGIPLPNATEVTDGPLAGEVSATAVDPGNSRRVLATDGTILWETRDSGCRWEVKWEIPIHPSPGLLVTRDSEISSIEIVRDAGKKVTIYLTLGSRLNTRAHRLPDASHAVSPPIGLHVVKSEDDGRSWVSVDEGLPPGGQYPLLRAAPSDPQVLYLSVQLGAQIVQGGKEYFRTLYYRSNNAGETWEPRSELLQSLQALTGDDRQAGGPSPYWYDFLISPRRPNRVWAWDHNHIFQSSDGARSWAAIQDPAAKGEAFEPGAYDMASVPYGKTGHALVVAPALGCGVASASDCQEPFLLVSTNDGRAWRGWRIAYNVRGWPVALASSGRGRVIAITSSDPQSLLPVLFTDAYLLDVRQIGRPWRDISPSFTKPLIFESYPAGGSNTAFVMTTRDPGPWVFPRLETLERFVRK